MTDANVLVVVLDSVRATNTATGGHHRETLPRLRRFYREYGGVRYTGARAPAIWSYPSHISLFTGLPAGAHRVDSDRTLFDPTTESLFDRLDHGHDTAVFSTNPFLSRREWNLGTLFDATNPGVDTEHGRLGRLWQVCAGRSMASRLCEAAYDWIRVAGRRRWAVCLNLMDAHSPYVPVRGHNVGSWRSLLSPRVRGYGEGESESFERTEQEFRAMESLYDGCIRQADAAVGWLLERLVADGILADTHVVVTADHGEGFGEPNEVDGSPVSFHWNAVNEETLHVPLYERPPGQEGQTVREGLAALTRLPAAVTDGAGFGVDRCTVEHLYGGNVSADAGWTGEHARVLYEQQSDCVVKYIDDPRGTTVRTFDRGTECVETEADHTASPGDVRRRVGTAFESLPSANARLNEAVDRTPDERLDGLGYI